MTAATARQEPLRPSEPEATLALGARSLGSLAERKQRQPNRDWLWRMGMWTWAEATTASSLPLFALSINIQLVFGSSTVDDREREPVPPGAFVL